MRVPTFAAVDTETTGLSPWKGARMFASGAVLSDGTRVFERGGSYSKLRAICADPEIDKVFHNAKFDMRMLSRAGIEVRGKVWDTMIFAHLLDGRDARGKLNLDAVASKYVPNEVQKLVAEIEQWFADHGMTKRHQKDYSKLPNEILEKRCIGDANLTACIFKRLYPTVATLFPLLLEQEHELLHVVNEAEERGMMVDLDEAVRQSEEFTEIAEDALDVLECAWGDPYFNINSPTHQRELLNRLGIGIKLEQLAGTDKKRRTKKGGLPKLDDYNLRRVNHPIPHIMLVGKAALKMRNTFLSQILDQSVDSVLHTNLNQLGTRTGRFSSSNPNLQNIPIEGDRRTAYTEEEAEMSYELTGYTYAPHIKRNFVCRPGYAHIHSDKIQAEMVALAHYANSQVMIDIFDQGISIHDGLCRILYGQFTKGLKTRTKAVVFGFVYGAGDTTLAAKIGGNLAEARSTRARLGRALPDLPRWKGELEEQVAARGYVETLHGRRHYLHSGHSYKAVNSVCQGTVGDEIKGCMVRLNRRLKSEGWDARILLNIHDDVVTECAIDQVPYVVPLIYEEMNSSPLPYRAKPRADMNITYTRWSDLMEIEAPYQPETFTREAFHAHHLAKHHYSG